MQLQMLSELRINLLLALQPLPKEAVLQRSVDILTRHVYLFGKLFRRMQQLSVSQFVALPMCSDLVMYYWSKVVQASDAPSEYIAGITLIVVSSTYPDHTFLFRYTSRNPTCPFPGSGYDIIQRQSSAVGTGAERWIRECNGYIHDPE